MVLAWFVPPPHPRHSLPSLPTSRVPSPGLFPCVPLLLPPYPFCVCPVSAHCHGGHGVRAWSCVASCATTCSSLRRSALPIGCRCSAWPGSWLRYGPWGGGGVVLVVLSRPATGMAGDGLGHVFCPPIRMGARTEHCRHGYGLELGWGLDGQAAGHVARQCVTPVP